MASEAKSASSVRTVAVPCSGIVFTTKSTTDLKFCAFCFGNFMQTTRWGSKCQLKHAGYDSIFCSISPATEVNLSTELSCRNGQIKFAIFNNLHKRPFFNANLKTPISWHVLSVYHLHFNSRANVDNLQC